MKLIARIAMIDELAAITFESLLYAFARQDAATLGPDGRAVSQYQGGQWRDHVTRNAETGAAMHWMLLPESMGEVIELRCGGNGYVGTVDVRTASAALCLMALSHALNRLHGYGRNADALVEFYHAMRDAAFDNFDGRAIAAFLD